MSQALIALLASFALAAPARAGPIALRPALVSSAAPVPALPVAGAALDALLPSPAAPMAALFPAAPPVASAPPASPSPTAPILVALPPGERPVVAAAAPSALNAALYGLRDAAADKLTAFRLRFDGERRFGRTPELRSALVEHDVRLDELYARVLPELYRPIPFKTVPLPGRPPGTVEASAKSDRRGGRIESTVLPVPGELERRWSLGDGTEPIGTRVLSLAVGLHELSHLIFDHAVFGPGEMSRRGYVMTFSEGFAVLVELVAYGRLRERAAELGFSAEESSEFGRLKAWRLKALSGGSAGHYLRGTRYWHRVLKSGGLAGMRAHLDEIAAVRAMDAKARRRLDGDDKLAGATIPSLR